MGNNIFLPQVTRIPITGPEPYNTLVCVQAESSGGPQWVKPGVLSTWTVSVPTAFRLAGFDQRVPPAFAHSTSAYLSSMGPAKDGSWTYAVNQVSGAGFEPIGGTYYVNIEVALQPSDPLASQCVSLGDLGGYCWYALVVQVTSYVLCYEPPPPKRSTSGASQREGNARLVTVGDALGSGLVARLARGLDAPIRVQESVAPSPGGPANPPTPPGPCRCT